MADFNYWKRQYKDTWEQASDRESTIMAYLKQASGRSIELVGFGSGSTSFLQGPALSYGHEKGDADLLVTGTNIYLEVTGPLVKTVTPEADLWVRPDKIENARKYKASRETWIVHHLPMKDLIRVVRIDSRFWSSLKADEFPTVEPMIRGVRERYYSIPAAHHCVRSCSELIQRLKSLKIGYKLDDY